MISNIKPNRREKGSIILKLFGPSSLLLLLFQFFLLSHTLHYTQSESTYYASSSSSSSYSYSYSSNSNSNHRETQRYQNLPSTTFAPSGKLLKVEQITKSSSDVMDMSSPLSIALHCENKDCQRDFILVVMSRPLSPHLHITTSTAASSSSSRNVRTTSSSSATSTTMGQEKKDLKNQNGIGTNPSNENYYEPLYLPHIKKTNSNNNNNDNQNQSFSNSRTSNSIPFLSILGKSTFAVVGGNAIDSTILLQRVKEMVISLQQANSVGDGVIGLVPTGILARRLADAAQSSTQTLGGRSGRMLKSSSLIIGSDRELEPHTNSSIISNNLWRVDPNGQFWNCNAAAVGRGAGVAELLLMKRIGTWIRNKEKEVSIALKQRQEQQDNNNDEEEQEEEDLGTNINNSRSNEEGDENKEEEDIESLLNYLSNEDVNEYLSTLDYDDALKLACDVLFEVLESRKGSFTRDESNDNGSSQEENKGNGVDKVTESEKGEEEEEEWIKFRDLQCMVLDSSSYPIYNDNDDTSDSREDLHEIQSDILQLGKRKADIFKRKRAGTIHYLSNIDVWDRVKSLTQRGNK